MLLISIITFGAILLVAAFRGRWLSRVRLPADRTLPDPRDDEVAGQILALPCHYDGLFIEQYEIQLGKDLVADTTSETTSTVEDMAGFDEVTFLVKLGDVDAAAVLTFAVKENTASSTSSPTPTAVALDDDRLDRSGSAITSGNLVLTEDGAGNLDDKIIAITVAKSRLTKRYVFLSITATVESYEVDAIITLKGRPRSAPVTQPTDVFAAAYGFA